MERRTLSRDKIIIVEDDLVVLMSSAQTLRDAGLTVLEAESGDACADLLCDCAQDVGVVFSDIDMPGRLNGLALAKVIQERWPFITVVLTSGRCPATSAALPTLARFLPKPYDLDEVSAMMTSMTES